MPDEPIRFLGSQPNGTPSNGLRPIASNTLQLRSIYYSIIGEQNHILVHLNLKIHLLNTRNKEIRYLLATSSSLCI